MCALCHGIKATDAFRKAIQVPCENRTKIGTIVAWNLLKFWILVGQVYVSQLRLRLAAMPVVLALSRGQVIVQWTDR